MRLTHRIADLPGGRVRSIAASVARRAGAGRLLPRSQAGPGPDSSALPAVGVGAPDRPGTPAADPSADSCAAARAAAEGACALADRMHALAVASGDRLKESRRAYDEHAGRRERAVAIVDPRAVRAAKDENQAAFRRARLAAVDRASLEVAAREWLREIDRVNARSREAVRAIAREDAAEAGLLREVERLGLEADGARIAAESAGAACRNARIGLAECEESERLGLVRSASTGALTAAPAGADGLPAILPGEPVATKPAGAGGPAGQPVEDGVPAVLPLLAGNRGVMLRIAAELAGGDVDAERRWQLQLAGLVDAVNARAIDSAVLVFPEEHAFWGLFSQAQCREIAAALAALGYRYDGMGGFADGRVPGQRELSLAIGYAGLDPMRIRFWPSEAALPELFADVQVDSGRFVAEAAGDLTLGEMIDLLGRRAEDLSELWNAWGRVRPLLLAPV